MKRDLCTLLLLFGCGPLGFPGQTDMKTAVAVVQLLQDVPAGELGRYYLRDFDDRGTLQAVPPGHESMRGEGRGRVWVYRTASNLEVFIETLDRGHAGEYGLAYSENGSPPRWRHDEWGDRWSVGRQIDEHWWLISYELG